MDKKEIEKEREKFFQELDKEKKVEKIVKKKKVIEKAPKHSEYFEGQIQLRNINKEILDYVDNRIIKANENVPKVVKHSGYDVDYYVSSKKILRQIGKELVEMYGGYFKESAQLFSKDKQTSKNIYRLNVFYKAHELIKNEIIVISDSKVPLKVTGFLKENIFAEDLILRKKIKVDIKDVSRKLNKFEKKVIQINPEIMVLDENFQPIKIENPIELKQGQNVKVVFFDEKCYLV